MNRDESPQSLADSAAEWVPPWARTATPGESVPARKAEIDDVGVEPANESVAVAEPEAVDEAVVEVEPDPVPEIELQTVAEIDVEPADAPEAEATAEAELAETEEPVAEAGLDEFGWPAEPEPEPEHEPEPAVPPAALSADQGEVTVDSPDMGDHNSLIDEQAGVQPTGVEAEEGEAAEDEPEPVSLSDEELRGALEAILLVVDEPVTEMTLAEVLGLPTERVVTALRGLADEYATTGRGFEARLAAGGWRLYTRPQYADYVEKFVLDGQQVRLTQAALETLAVVAYKQPVTRSRISAIRGVNCDGVIKTLVGRGLVEECGAEPDSGAFLYRTTTLFLEKLGINGVEELPPLAPFLPDNMDEFDGQR